MRVPAQKDVDETVAIAGPWSATATSSARFEGGIELLLHPTNGIRIEPPTAAASIDTAFGLKAEAADGSPMILIGQAGGSRLELQRFSIRLPIRLSASIGVASPEAQFGAEMAITGGKIVIDASQADGFIATILGGIKVESAFEVGAAYDTANGLRFTGSATIEIAIPSHLELGPLTIPNVYIIGGFQAGTIPIELSADLGVMLGPIAASVNRLGAKATISFPPGGGNAGVAQIDIALQAAERRRPGRGRRPGQGRRLPLHRLPIAKSTPARWSWCSASGSRSAPSASSRRECPTAARASRCSSSSRWSSAPGFSSVSASR